jgi:hypothetical protein
MLLNYQKYKIGTFYTQKIKCSFFGEIAAFCLIIITMTSPSFGTDWINDNSRTRIAPISTRTFDQ